MLPRNAQLERTVFGTIATARCDAGDARVRRRGFEGEDQRCNCEERGTHAFSLMSMIEAVCGSPLAAPRQIRGSNTVIESHH